MHIYLFSGTHWDREWYLTFQGFRYHLVKMLDHLVNYLETEDSESTFHMDGQTIVLEDYAEINPEGYERLKELIRKKRVLIGPWYCMPDENLISGESLIRNLLKGDEICREIGTDPWKCGYICDIFGHMGQMPQILKGVEIHSAVLGRGTDDHTTPSMFVWESPDGSSVDVFRLPDMDGYGSFTSQVDAQRVAFRTIDAEDPVFAEKAKKHIAYLKGLANVPFVVLWQALDHEPFHEETQSYKRKLQELFPEDTVRQTDLLEALTLIEDRSVLPHLKGELREPGKDYESGFNQILTHVLSSRQFLKHRNDHCQTRLEKRMEPALLLFEQFGFQAHDSFRKQAWKHLLQNHPHDSICGCSIAQVHKDMIYRFDQVDSICDILMEDATWKMSGGLKFAGGDNSYLTLINTTPFLEDDMVEVEVPFNQHYAKWHEPEGYEDIAAFRLYDEENNELPFAITGRKTNAQRRGYGGGGVPCDIYTLLIPFRRKGLGTSSIRIGESKKPVRQFGGFADNRGNLDNGIIRAEINPDGTIDLKDHQSGKVYRNLLSLQDGAEIGDGWKHCAPVVDQVHTYGRLVEVAVLLNNPAASRVRIVREMEIPKRMRRLMKGNIRSEERTSLRLEFTLTLAKGARNLDISLKVDNTARDHILRLVMPTGVEGPYYETNHNFEFVHRDCRIDEETGTWREVMDKETPMAGIVLKRDSEGCGLAFVSGGGLHECIVDERGDMAVTLLRAFARTIATNGEAGGQELFEHDYRFALMPLDEMVTRTQLQRRQDALMAPPEGFVTLEGMGRQLFQVEGTVCVSALKPAEDGSKDWILRLYNVEEEETCVKITSRVPFARAALCNMLEEEKAPLAWDENSAVLQIPANKVLTVRFSNR